VNQAFSKRSERVIRNKKESDDAEAKVLLVSNGFPPVGQWGTEFYTHQLASGLQARGREVAVFIPVRESEGERYSLKISRRHGLDLFELANAGDPKKSFTDSYKDEGVEQAFARVLREFKPKTVHFNHFLWGLSVGLPRVAAEFGARVVATVTDLGLLCHRGQFYNSELQPCGGPSSVEECARCVREPSKHDAKALELFIRRLAVRGAASLGGFGRIVVASDLEQRVSEVREAASFIDSWVFPTKALLEEFQSHGLALGHAEVLPYGIDEEAFKLPERGEKPRALRFSYLGQFMPHKGLEHLLAAVHLMESRLPESVAPWTLHCHGHGSPGRHQLYAERAFEPVRGSRRVIDAGCFPPLDAPRVMNETDVLIVPSLWMENAPLAVLQARAAGVPVIASDVAGVREVMEVPLHGALVPPGDVEALADAMRAAILEGPRRYQPDPVIAYSDHLDRVEQLYGERSSVIQPSQAPPRLELKTETENAVQA